MLHKRNNLDVCFFEHCLPHNFEQRLLGDSIKLVVINIMWTLKILTFLAYLIYEISQVCSRLFCRKKGKYFSYYICCVWLKVNRNHEKNAFQDVLLSRLHLAEPLIFFVAFSFFFLLLDENTSPNRLNESSKSLFLMLSSWGFTLSIFATVRFLVPFSLILVRPKLHNDSNMF